MKVWGPEWKHWNFTRRFFLQLCGKFFDNEQTSRDKRRSVGWLLGMYALKEANEGIVFLGEK